VQSLRAWSDAGDAVTTKAVEVEAEIPANAAQMPESFDGLSMVGPVMMSHDGVFHGSKPDRSPGGVGLVRDDPAALQAVFEQANANRVRAMHIAMLTPPLALIAVP
jgi:hypothetical protein